MPDAEPDAQPEKKPETIEEWILHLRDEAERVAPEALDKLAAAAKSVARYLDDMAENARAKQAPAKQSGNAPRQIDEPPGDA